MNMTCLQPNKPKTVFWRYRRVLKTDTGVVVWHPVIVVVVVDAVVGLDIHDTRGVSTMSAWQMDRWSSMWHRHRRRCGDENNQTWLFPNRLCWWLETCPWRSCFLSFLLMAKRSQRRNPDIPVRISPSANKFNDDDDDDDDDDEQSGGTASVGIGMAGVGNVMIGNDDGDGG